MMRRGVNSLVRTPRAGWAWFASAPVVVVLLAALAPPPPTATAWIHTPTMPFLPRAVTFHPVLPSRGRVSGLQVMTMTKVRSPPSSPPEVMDVDMAKPLVAAPPAPTSVATTVTATQPVIKHMGLRGLWQSYLEILDAYPLATKICTAFVTSAFSDLIAQSLTYHGVPSEFTVDVKRLLIFMALNGFYGAPCGHYWFNFLDYLIKRPDIAPRLPKPHGPVLFQMVLDQTLSASIVNSGFLLMFWGLLAVAHGEPQTVSELTERLARDLWPMMVVNWKLWPLAKIISFSFVPLNLRVFYANIVSIVWTAYLSSLA